MTKEATATESDRLRLVVSLLDALGIDVDLQTDRPVFNLREERVRATVKLLKARRHPGEFQGPPFNYVLTDSIDVVIRALSELLDTQSAVRQPNSIIAKQSELDLGVSKRIGKITVRDIPSRSISDLDLVEAIRSNREERIEST